MSKEDVVGLAIVGIGGWSGVIADGVARSKKAKLVTCYTRTPEKRAAYVKKYGCDQEKSFEDILKRKDVDGVLLTTPNAVHMEHAILAAQHGKHVFVDKPIANTMADGRKMIEACEKAKIVLLVGQDIRRLKGLRKIKEMLDKGAIGKPVMAESNFSARLGFELTPDKWRWYGDDSGCPAGGLMTMGIHHADTLSYFFGPVQSVYGMFAKLYTPASVEDVTNALFQFESGVVGYIGSSYATLRTNWIYVYGTDGTLQCTVTLPNVPFEEYLKIWSIVDRYTTLQLFEKGKDKPVDIPLEIGDIILEQVDEFAACIRTGAKPETDGKVGLASLSVVRGAIESARTGKKVMLADL